MRQLFLAAALSGAALLAGYGTANAQVAIEIPGAGVYVGPGYDDDDYGRRRANRYYGYNRYDDDRYHGRRGQLRSDFQACGRSAYWDGNACQPGRRP